MKKIAILFLLMALTVLISGCGAHTDTESSEGPEGAEASRFSGFQADNVGILKDEVTGCKYIVFLHTQPNGAAGNIAPLMNATGTQDCE